MRISLWMSRMGLALVFLYCGAASIFFSDFSEIHLTFSFLPFPVFIGEIVLGLCFFLFAWTCKDKKSFEPRTALLLGLYFGWVIVKALINYAYDGPLTCRNAALFYYPAFAVFTYCFYRGAMIPRKAWMFLAFLVSGVIFFKAMNIWYWWTYGILLVVALWNVRSVPWRWIGWISLALILMLGFGYLYKGPRAHFVSVFCAVAFLVLYFGSALSRRHNFVRLGVLLTAFLLFIGGFFVFSSRDAVSSMLSLHKIMEVYQEKDRMYRENEPGFLPRTLPARLYNSNDPWPGSRAGSEAVKVPVAELRPASVAKEPPVAEVRPASVAKEPPVAEAKPASVAKEPPVVRPLMKNIVESVLHYKVRGERPLELDEVNIVFRLFVWRDMAKELIKERAWMGFSFGRPQRSRSLEVLCWAASEWSRDGWITPHNSYFHIIYRAGIFGLFLIGVLFLMMWRLIRDLFVLNSVEGGFLVAALVYWLVLSNFFVILELPHNAVLIWALLGVTCAHRDLLKLSKSEERDL